MIPLIFTQESFTVKFLVFLINPSVFSRYNISTVMWVSRGEGNPESRRHRGR